MIDTERLQRLLDRIDGRSYPAYRDLKGRWRLGEVTVVVEHVQGDPFAAPSRLSVEVDVGLGEHAEDPDAAEATEDFLLRRFAAGLRSSRRGSGKSGQLRCYRPGPEICERSAVRLHVDGRVQVRFAAGLPARGRRVLGREARGLLMDDVVHAALGLRLDAAAQQALAAHIASVQRQRALRRQLADHGLVAFVENGSRLPRSSGITQAPLDDAVPFTSPESLAVTLPVPGGEAVGLGIRQGVTLIVGGGFHGKSTVLQALARGHLDHVPGDGREGVVSLPDTVKIRAEDGRSVASVDISAFLRDLPGGRSTAPFHTDDASGSTSQAAALVEAMEAGARLLLLDEDTSATNLLVRDARMRALIPREREPITPLVERVRQLAEAGTSTLMVVGGVGDWLAVADTVIAMTDFVPSDVTAAAHEVAGEAAQPPDALPTPLPRVVRTLGREAGKIRARDTRSVRFGDDDVDLIAVEQVLDASHAWTLGHALRFLFEELVDGERALPAVLDALDAIVDDEGVEALSPFSSPSGDLIRPRRHEVAAALNRLRSLRIAR
ncbi:MAG: ABC-ATPase domain-containing protein [Myxococcales bacterium]|nr:ABC-ATPase domain-containing protein [Myxococcales bacterium]